MVDGICKCGVLGVLRSVFVFAIFERHLGQLKLVWVHPFGDRFETTQEDLVVRSKDFASSMSAKSIERAICHAAA